MTRPHHHPLRGARGLASIEHEHPGPEHPHVHDGQPELGPSTTADAMLERMRAMAARNGRRLVVPPG